MIPETEPRVRRQLSLADQVYDFICDEIATGQLQPGDRLNIEQLAPRYGVSQTPVREAFVRLKRDGLAINGPDNKLQVVPITKIYVREIYLVRSVLEGLAAEQAAENLSAAELEPLRELLEQGTMAIEQGDAGAYRNSGTSLHQLIHQAAGNHALTRELRSLRVHAAHIIGFSKQRFGDPLARVHHEEHQLIFNALADRNPFAARSAMENHIRRAGERIVNLIEPETTDSVSGHKNQ